MSAPTINPEWGDDILAIAEAVGVVTPSGRPHLTAPGTLLDLTVLLAAEAFAQTHPDLLDEPVPYLPTSHDVCHACADILCGCEDPCEQYQRDACSHWGKPFCYSCAPHNCPDCKADQDRWGR
jgi:hypothetical protein